MWVHSWWSLGTWLAASPVLSGQGQEKGPRRLSQFSAWVSAELCLSEARWDVSSAPRAGDICGPARQDSRFEISENGTLRINNVEVYDGTMYKCVSSTPAGSIEGYARVHVLGTSAAPHSPAPGLHLRHPQLRALPWQGGSLNTPPVCCREAEVHPTASAPAVHGV